MRSWAIDILLTFGALLAVIFSKLQAAQGGVSVPLCPLTHLWHGDNTQHSALKIFNLGLRVSMMIVILLTKCCLKLFRQYSEESTLCCVILFLYLVLMRDVTKHNDVCRRSWKRQESWMCHGYIRHHETVDNNIRTEIIKISYCSQVALGVI